MVELSLGVVVAWYIGAGEAMVGRYQYIEKEHLFIGLCKVGDMLDPAIVGQVGVRFVDIDRVRGECGRVYELFRRFGVDRVFARRRLRGVGKLVLTS